MASAGGGYTRAVTVAKIVLPLIALAILSALFFLARNSPQGEPLRYVEDDVKDLADRQRLGEPVHQAVTKEGAEITIVAQQLVPDAKRPRVTHGTDLAAQMLTQDDQIYDIDADTGVIDEVAMESTLTGDVVILTSDGYRMTTDEMMMRTDLTYLETHAPVHADGPLGTLDAGKMQIYSDPDDETRTRMVFTGGVRLLYLP
ncbi:MAG: LPS export ABC transporter periplasmic protein LptC [Rhodobacteraceae bacterium]|nr:LPS export ABC transporter periplasmic protein LptC [Paracoccaceae bacterium]